MIKDLIPSWDIRTHACLYLSSPVCADIYDSHPDNDAFWKLACWQAGIGLLYGEDEAKVKWRDVAVDTMEKDGFCDHPECGASLLEYNRAFVPRLCEAMSTYFA